MFISWSQYYYFEFSCYQCITDYMSLSSLECQDKYYMPKNTHSFADHSTIPCGWPLKTDVTVFHQGLGGGGSWDQLSRNEQEKGCIQEGQLRIRFLENEFWAINYQSIYKKWVQVNIKWRQ